MIQIGLKHPEYRSSIPINARQEGENFYVEGVLVGKRHFEEDGTICIEYGLNPEGRHHGYRYEFDDQGRLECKEFYHNGALLGPCRQWIGGTFVGDYPLVNGSGYDIWKTCRYDLESGEVLGVVLSEVRTLKHGDLHGLEWWINDDQETIYIEKAWFKNKLHGIERQWNCQSGLCRGYPKYWVYGKRVNKSQYLHLAKQDTLLPPFRDEDQQPIRVFPADLQAVIDETKACFKNICNA